MNLNKILNTSFLTAAAAVFMFTAAANAETVIETTTTVTPQMQADTRYIDVDTFDDNNDGILTMSEVGTELFYIFDRDGNEVIDNIEFETNSMMTLTPMQKETVTVVDVYADGNIDQATYTYEEFIQQSKLDKFTDDNNGLSPEEFINDEFLALDDDGSTVLEREEWEEAYIAMLHPKSAEQERYN